MKRKRKLAKNTENSTI